MELKDMERENVKEHRASFNVQFQQVLPSTQATEENKLITELITQDEIVEETDRDVSRPSVLENEIFFSTHEKLKAERYLAGDPISLIATNIPTYMGGRHNPWVNSEQSMALRSPQGEEQYKPQSFSDGLLELTSVDTIPELGLGMTKRVGQAEGGITLRFNDVIDDRPFTIDKDGIDASDFYSYFQIDGEYFKAKNLTSITLQLCSSIKDGSIRVLCRRQS
jgi:hypothetical protein